MKPFNYLSKKGFTLMELLITVILVAVLASYSVYYYNNTIDEGKLNAAKGKLAALGGALERYKIENVHFDTAGCKDVVDVRSTAAEITECFSDDPYHLANLFNCGYAERHLGIDENFDFSFGCASECGADGVNVFSVFMTPRTESSVFPVCAYFDPDTDKVKEVKK